MIYCIAGKFPAAALKVNLLYGIESYDSLIGSRNLIHEIYDGEITLKNFCLENYLLYGRLDGVCHNVNL